MVQASIRVVVPQGIRGKLLDVLLRLKGPTEVLDECQGCWIVQDAENDHALTYLVQWQSRDRLVEHIRSERFRRLLPYIDMSVEPPEIEIDTVDRLGGLDFLLDLLSAKTE